MTWAKGLTLALTLLAALAPERARAAELVAFLAPGCSWCVTWEAEVGAVYDKTGEGRILPLRRVLKDGPRPVDLVFVHGIIYTPTFVVVHQGQEAGRILGYPGQEFFWGMLNQIIAHLPADARSAYRETELWAERPPP